MKKKPMNPKAIIAIVRRLRKPSRKTLDKLEASGAKLIRARRPIIVLLLGMAALGLIVQAQMMPIPNDSTHRIQTATPTPMQEQGVELATNESKQLVTDAEAAAHGVMEIVPGQPEPQLQLPYTDVVASYDIIGQGGVEVYLCPNGVTPLTGNCRSQLTGAGRDSCTTWTKTFNFVFRVPCDGQSHTLPTRTIYIRNFNQYEQVGSITPNFVVPLHCQNPPPPYLINRTRRINASFCCAVGWHWCDPPDPAEFGRCPPYCYVIPRRCCRDGWDCHTFWEPLGELYYGTCCRDNPPWGLVCE